MRVIIFEIKLDVMVNDVFDEVEFVETIEQGSSLEEMIERQQ